MKLKYYYSLGIFFLVIVGIYFFIQISNQDLSVDTTGTLAQGKGGPMFCVEKFTPRCIGIGKTPNQINYDYLVSLSMNETEAHIKGVIKNIRNDNPNCELSQVGCEYKELFIENIEIINSGA